MKPSARTLKHDLKHPFFCTKKGCRKSAWETPEYLSEQDWAIAEAALGFFRANDQAGFDALISDREVARAYFHRIVGWPEGLSYYCGGSVEGRRDYFAGFACDRDIAEKTQLARAVAARHGEIFAATASA